MKTMKQIFLYFCILSFALSTFFAFGLGKSKAAEPTEILPTVQFADITTSGLENSPSHPIRVYLSQAATQDVTVNYSVITGTATLGKDYLLNGKTLEIKEGQTYADINLALLDNSLVDGTRNVELGLSTPINATLGENTEFDFVIIDDDSAPVTTLITTPQHPNGQDGWYVTKPEFQLEVDRLGKSYYRINGGQWLEYQEAVTVSEGINVIEYYSVDAYGNQEAVRVVTLKVDTIKPNVPNFEVSLNDQGQANLSWAASNDSVTYQVWRNGLLLANLTGGINNYLDSTLVANQNYEYYIVAIDQAGNKTVSEKTVVLYVVKYVVKEEIKEVKAAQAEVQPLPELKSAPKIKKSIGIASSTVAESKAVAGDSTISDGPATDLTISSEKKEDESTPTKNWNNWLLAISVLIILVGAAIGTYYGYGAYLASRKESVDRSEKKSKSRW